MYLTLQWFYDIGLIVVAFFLSYGLRQTLIPLPPIQPPSFYISFLVATLIFFIFSFLVFRLYIKERMLFSLSYLIDYLKAFFLWAALLVAFAFFTKTDYSRVVVTLFFGISVILITTLRFFILWTKPNRVSVVGDPEILKAAGEVIYLSSISADSLSLLEGIRSQRSPTLLYRFAKRYFDVVLAFTGLLVTLPFFPLIALWIRKNTLGKVIISQKRIGRDGKRFTIYKFRTMIVNTELYASAPRNSHDPRITRVGNFLRKYSLDELPQLWNVLKGDMSIVGPRPEMPFIVEKYEPWQKIRLEVRPGITGLWQILGRKDLPLEENIEYDLYYVFNQSLFLDLAIIFKTIPHLLFSRGAY